MPQDAPQSWGPTVIVSPSDAADAQAVIARQLDALRRGDGDAAIAESAPVAQRRFPSAAAFMATVRAEYGALIQSDRTRFGAIRGAAATPTQAGTWNQTVTLATRDGDTWTAVYGLEREADGTLKITSCVLITNAAGET